MTWHVPQALWESYAAGALGGPGQAAVEAHLVECRGCQRLAARFAGAGRADDERLWTAVHTEISHPRPAWPLRWARRFGLGDADVAVLAACDNLRLPWAVAIGGALASVIVAANLGRFQDVGFVAMSPLIPVLAVLAAFDATDPLRELTAATPLSRLRIGLLRTLATLLVALPTLVCLAALVPALHPLIWVWLLPSLGLTAGALIALRWLQAWQAAAVTVGGWTIAVLAIDGAGQLGQVGRSTGQAIFAAFAVVTAICYWASSRGTARAGAAR